MDNKIVKINNNDLSVKEFNGQRVVIFKDIDMLHQRVEGTANKRFIYNKKHFIADEDYFEITGETLREFKRLPNFGIGEKASKLTLITESGYLMLVKSLQDDLAWKVQRELVNNYFRVKENVQAKPTCIEDVLIQSLHEMKEVKQTALEAKEEVQDVRNDFEDFKKDLPLIGDEPEELQAVVRRAGTKALGGYNSPAYCDKSLSKKVYRNVWDYIKGQFNVKKYKAIKRKYLSKAIELAESYKAPFHLQEEIDMINNQSKLDV